MARTGRPRNKVPRIKWDVYIRQDLAAQIELLLADPMRERVKYGARGELIESLLEEWLQKQRAGVQIVEVEKSLDTDHPR